jgi:hypothetical protein
MCTRTRRPFKCLNICQLASIDAATLSAGPHRTNVPPSAEESLQLDRLQAALQNTDCTEAELAQHLSLPLCRGKQQEQPSMLHTQGIVTSMRCCW